VIKKLAQLEMEERDLKRGLIEKQQERQNLLRESIASSATTTTIQNSHPLEMSSELTASASPIVYASVIENTQLSHHRRNQNNSNNNSNNENSTNSKNSTNFNNKNQKSMDYV